MSENTTTMSRFLKSYEIRRGYQGGVEYPPAISGVQGAIDIHCHCDAAHQDALSVAKLASKNGMRGLLYKSIAGKNRAESVQKCATLCSAGPMKKRLSRFCAGLEPTSLTVWRRRLSLKSATCLTPALTPSGCP